MAASQEPDREQRIEEHAKAAETNDPDMKRKRTAKEPENPKIERAKEIIDDLIQDLWEVGKSVEKDPAVAGLVTMIRRRVTAAANELDS